MLNCTGMIQLNEALFSELGGGKFIIKISVIFKEELIRNYLKYKKNL